MKIAIELFVSLFILIMMVALCIGIVSSDLDVMEARDFYYSCVNELQKSNFADSVIDSYITEATNNGYSLNIQIYQTADGDRSADISLKYIYDIPVIGVEQEKLINGFVS